MHPPRPVLTFDLDGVLCRPPLGMNPGSGRTKQRETLGRKNLLWRTESWRYYGRRPMPGAVDGLRALAERFDCRLLSARGEAARRHTESWLQRYFGLAPRVHLRPDWRETPAQFKTRMVVELGSVAHFEDDPFTAAWVAELIPQVFLVDWRRNRWLEAANIHRIRRLDEALPVLEAP